MKTILDVYAKRKQVADEDTQGLLKVLEMVGVQKLTMDVPSTFGDIRALREILMRNGLTVPEEYAALAAEGTNSFLREVLASVQQQKQEGEA